MPIQKETQDQHLRKNCADQAAEIYTVRGQEWCLQRESFTSPFSPEIGGEGGRRPVEGADLE